MPKHALNYKAAVFSISTATATDYTKLKSEKPKGNGVRKQWKYNDKFTIQLMYVQDEDGNYTEQLVLKRNEAS